MGKTLVDRRIVLIEWKPAFERELGLKSMRIVLFCPANLLDEGDGIVFIFLPLSQCAQVCVAVGPLERLQQVLRSPYNKLDLSLNSATDVLSKTIRVGLV